MDALEVRPPEPSEEESVGALVGRLGTDLTRIVRAEVAAFQVRLTTALDALKTSSAGFVAGALCGATGFALLMLALVLVLSRWMPAWVAAVAVGAGLLGLGTVVTLIAVRGLTHGVTVALTDVRPLEEPHGH